MGEKEDLNKYRSAYEDSFPYYWDETLLLDAYVRKVIHAMKDKVGVRALSLGIGRQIVSKAIFEKIDLKEYQVVEGSEEIISDYRQNASPPDYVEVIHSYFEDVELSGVFDMIEMGFVLEHVDDPEAILHRYREFLSETGSLFIAVPNARSLHRLLGHAAGMMSDIYSLSQSDLDLGHKRYFDSTSIRSLVDGCGYQVIAEHGLMLKPLTTGQIHSLDLGSSFDEALIEVGYGLPQIANGVMIEARLR